MDPRTARSRPEAPTAAPAAQGPEPTSLEPARLRWIQDGRVEELSLDPELGPRLVPMRHAGAALATLLLDALDQAAASGETRIRVAREGIELFADVPESWERPPMPPSAVVGGEDRTPPTGERRLESHRADLRRRDVLEARLGRAALALLREYPRQRRILAATRVRLESEALRFDDAERDRNRARWVAASGIIASCAGIAFGVLSDMTPLFAGASLLFFLTSAMLALLGLEQPRLRRRRADHERRVTRICNRAHELDETAEVLARRAGFANPWEAASFLGSQPGPKNDPAPRAPDAVEILDRARAVAGALGVDPAQITAEMVQGEPRLAGSRGWPAEVSSRDGAATAAGASVEGSRRRTMESLVEIGRLLARLDRGLPQPWPLILWDPWADHAAAERAELLVATAGVSAPRAVLAIVVGR